MSESRGESPTSALQLPPRLGEFGGEEFFVGECEFVFGGEDFGGEAFERVFCDGGVFLRAEEEADRRVLIGIGPVLARVVQIHVHLPGVGVGEFAHLEVDDDEAAQAAVEEEQVHAIPLVADPQPALAGDEAEFVAEFAKELLQMLDERFLEIALGIFVFEPEEL